MASLPPLPPRIIVLAAAISVCCALLGVVILVLTGHQLPLPPRPAAVAMPVHPRPASIPHPGPATGTAPPSGSPEDSDPPPQVVPFAGADGQELMAGATRITLFRLHGDREIHDEEGTYFSQDP